MHCKKPPHSIPCFYHGHTFCGGCGGARWSVGDAGVLAFLLALAIALALCADVIAEHCSENEVLLRRELTQWARDHLSDGCHTLPFAKEKVYPPVAHGLDDVVDTLPFQPVDCIVAILLIESVEYHLPYSLLELIDVVHEYFHVGQGHYLSLLHFYVLLAG